MIFKSEFQVKLSQKFKASASDMKSSTYYMIMLVYTMT